MGGGGGVGVVIELSLYCIQNECFSCFRLHSSSISISLPFHFLMQWHHHGVDVPPQFSQKSIFLISQNPLKNMGGAGGGRLIKTILIFQSQKKSPLRKMLLERVAY